MLPSNVIMFQFYFSLLTDDSKQGAVPDTVEKEVQGCGEVKEIHELDVLLQYCEEIFGKVVCITELEVEENNAMGWSV